ncbi:hypothetical protein M0P65_06505 [Candidatus Gracilibacteria bacterium]|jgi:hypothetical protein|nr:hypothetical protein [Candidatus Gracilibacteria bacterium]
MIRNLYKTQKIIIKNNEALKAEVSKALVVFGSIEEKIIWSQTILNDIDKKGIFASDDEIGWFFKNIQLIQDELNGFQFRINPESKKET